MYRTILLCSTFLVMSPMTFGSESLQSESELVTDAEFELATIRRNLAWIGGHIDNISNSVDTFFAPEQDVSKHESLVNVNLGFQTSEKLPSSTPFNFKLYIRLPKTEKRWNLFVESAIAPDEQSQKGSAQTASSEEEQQTNLGLSTLYKVSNTLGIRTRFGTDLTDGHIDPYLKIALRQEQALSKNWFVSVEPEWFWREVDGSGKELSLNLAYQYSEDHHFRSYSNLFRYDELPNWDIAQRFEWQHRVNNNNRVTYQVGRQWQWHEQSQPMIQDTYAQINWRNQFYEHWLFLVITPGVHAPIELNETLNPFIFIGFEAFSRKVPL